MTDDMIHARNLELEEQVRMLTQYKARVDLEVCELCAKVQQLDRQWNDSMDVTSRLYDRTKRFEATVRMVHESSKQHHGLLPEEVRKVLEDVVSRC